MYLNVTVQLMVICSAFFKYMRKKWEHNETVHQLFIEFKKAYDSVRREALYNILNEFGIHMKILSLAKCVLNKTFSRVWVGKNLCDMFLLRMF